MVGSGTSISGAGASPTTGSSTATGDSTAVCASGSSTSSIVRRGSSAVGAASSPTCGSAGGAVMVGVLGGAVGGSCFFLRLLTTSPLIAPTATRAMTTARMRISITHPVWREPPRGP